MGNTHERKLEVGEGGWGFGGGGGNPSTADALASFYDHHLTPGGGPPPNPFDLDATPLEQEEPQHVPPPTPPAASQPSQPMPPPPTGSYVDLDAAVAQLNGMTIELTLTDINAIRAIVAQAGVRMFEEALQLWKVTNGLVQPIQQEVEVPEGGEAGVQDVRSLPPITPTEQGQESPS